MKPQSALKKLLLSAAFAASISALQAAGRDFFQDPTYDPDTGMPIAQGPDYYDKIVKEKYIWDLTLDEWFNGPYATGGWCGARSQLEDNGVVPVLNYIGNFATNPTGGRARGATVTSSVNLGLGVDLYKVTGIKELNGWSLSGTFVWRFGNSLTKDYIGNEFNVQQNYGSQNIRLQSLFANYTKDFLDDTRFIFRFGRLAAGDTFLTKPIYWLYQNNAFDGNPVGIFKQMSWSAYPGATWGAFTSVKRSEGQYVKAGVYQINSPKQDSMDMHGFDWSFEEALGVNADFELGWDINHDDSGLSPGNVSAGLAADWYDSPYFSNPAVNSTFSYTVYVQADYMIWNMGSVKGNEPYYIPRKDEAYRDLRGLVAWFVAQYNPYEETALMPFFVNGGLLFNAPFTSRADDVICFGVAYGKYSDKLSGIRCDSYETVFELNYKFQINRFAFVQPNVQYILKPSGGEYPNAVVIGMQFGLNL